LIVVSKEFPLIFTVVAAPEYEPSSTRVPELRSIPEIDTFRSTDKVSEVVKNDAPPDTDIDPLISIVESPPAKVPSSCVKPEEPTVMEMPELCVTVPE
jgi:hypothetical protein